MQLTQLRTNPEEYDLLSSHIGSSGRKRAPTISKQPIRSPQKKKTKNIAHVTLSDDASSSNGDEISSTAIRSFFQDTINKEIIGRDEDDEDEDCIEREKDLNPEDLNEDEELEQEPGNKYSNPKSRRKVIEDDFTDIDDLPSAQQPYTQESQKDPVKKVKMTVSYQATILGSPIKLAFRGYKKFTTEEFDWLRLAE